MERDVRSYLPYYPLISKAMYKSTVRPSSSLHLLHTVLTYRHGVTETKTQSRRGSHLPYSWYLHLLESPTATRMANRPHPSRYYHSVMPTIYKWIPHLIRPDEGVSKYINRITIRAAFRLFIRPCILDVVLLTSFNASNLSSSKTRSSTPPMS